MRNLVKEYINSGKSLENLKVEFGISINEFDNLICLNYSQIDSPKTADIVRQCRGIVLDKNTLEIVHYPFYRFFNLQEVPTERELFNWNNAVALEKLDGSLFGVFYANNKWNISTRSQIGGKNGLRIGMLTFKDMFKNSLGNISEEEFFNSLNPNLDYTFELVGPENQIITPYSETKLYIIGIRDKVNDFKELNIFEYGLPECVKYPNVWKIVDEQGKFIGFDELAMKANKLENPTDEGFVVVDYSSYNSEYGYFPRVKVKNSSYVALHHLQSSEENLSLNYGKILELIWKNEQAECIAVMPHFKQYFDEVEQKFKKFQNEFSLALSKVNMYFVLPLEKRNDPIIKREFAQYVDKRFSSFMFNMFNKNLSFRETVDKCSALKPNYFKAFWEDYVSKF